MEALLVGVDGRLDGGIDGGSPRARSTSADEVLHGEAGLARIDTSGEEHGWTGRMFRRLQSAVTDEGEHMRRFAEYLREGHYIVGVGVGDDEAAKVRAAHAMRGAHPEFLVYYASNYIEDLGG